MAYDEQRVSDIQAQLLQGGSTAFPDFGYFNTLSGTDTARVLAGIPFDDVDADWAETQW